MPRPKPLPPGLPKMRRGPRWKTWKEKKQAIKRIVRLSRRPKKPLTQREIARREGVHPITVWRIQTRQGIKPSRQEMRERALALVTAGVPYPEAARQTGYLPNNLGRLARSKGVRSPIPQTRRLPPETVEKLRRQLRLRVITLNQMADTLGITIDTVRAWKRKAERALFNQGKFEEWLRLKWHTTRPGEGLFPDNRSYRFYWRLPLEGKLFYKEILILGALHDHYVKDPSEKLRLEKELKRYKALFRERNRKPKTPPSADGKTRGKEHAEE